WIAGRVGFLRAASRSGTRRLVLASGCALRGISPAGCRRCRRGATPDCRPVLAGKTAHGDGNGGREAVGHAGCLAEVSPDWLGAVFGSHRGRAVWGGT